MSGSTSIKCILVGIVIYFHLAFSQNINIIIPLNKTTTRLDQQLYETFVNLNQSSTLQVNFTDVKKNLSYIVFQVHSHIYNITLYRNVMSEDKIYGTNLGLHSEIGKKLDTFFVKNDNDFELKLLINVQGYTMDDPVPGGCNMEFPTPIAPYMLTSYNRHYLTVDFAPASIDVNCLDVNTIHYFFFMVYLPERDLGPDTYFDVLRNMTTIENIKRIGSKVSKGAWNNRRMFSAYPGTGAIYVVVAFRYISTTKHYSVYVPSHSYACSLTAEGDCELLEDALTEFLCASLFFIGLFICYFGHRFFMTQTFFIGFLSGLVVTYILISLIVTLDASALVLASAISGICVGAIRVVCWWLYGLPVFSIILTSADIGFLTSCILYYIVPESGKGLNEPVYMTFLRQDLNFWPIFVLIALLITLLLLSVSFIANLVCCAVIGAYAAIYPIDIYIGSNLKYILINVIRRATVPGFNKAVVMPPFQWKDFLLALLWLALSATGFLYQYYQNKGRPPFPPPPRSVRAVPEGPASVAVPCGSGYRVLDDEMSNNDNSLRARTRTWFNRRRNVNERTPLLA